MENQFFRGAERTIKYWYLPLLLGVLLIAVGLYAFTTPLESFIALSVLFAYTFLVTGILEIIYAFSNRAYLHGWAWSLAVGIIDFIVGILLVARPDISMLALPLFVGFGILFRSIVSIYWATALRKVGISEWSYMLVLGVLGLLFSFIMLWNPVFAGMTIVFYTAFAFILIGVFNVYISIKLKELKKLMK